MQKLSEKLAIPKVTLPEIGVIPSTEETVLPKLFIDVCKEELRYVRGMPIIGFTYLLATELIIVYDGVSSLAW